MTMTGSRTVKSSKTTGSSKSGSGNTSNGDVRSKYKYKYKYSQSKIEESLFGYLECTCSGGALLRLYGDEGRGMYAAKTILQRLPELARQFVLRLVASSNGGLAVEEMEQWCRHPKDVSLALHRMEALMVCRIASSTTTTTEEEEIEISSSSIVRLTEEFFRAIQKALTSWESSPWPEVTPAMYQTIVSQDTSASKESSTSPPTLEQLEIYTQARWDAVLHFLVGDTSSSSHSYEKPPPAVIHFLELTGLMQRDPEYTGSKSEVPLVISSKGYEFMLQDVHVQVWQLILQYFLSLEQHRKFEELRHEAILFLLCLSYCKVGCAYAASSLSNKHARTLMKDLKRFGLLYVNKVAGITLFYPTRVAVDLVVGSLTNQPNPRNHHSKNTHKHTTNTDDSLFRTSAAQTRALEAALALPSPSNSPHIAILVQTNFHLCAYTTSELHVKMLSLFCDLREYRRLPNVIMTRLSRDSVKAAFALGITAAQILRFLKMHAHPQLINAGEHLIPPNVEDQIWLWDRERTRVQFQEIFIVPCNTRAEFTAMKQYAIAQDAHAWSGTNNNKLMVNYEKADMIMSYLRKWRSSPVRPSTK